MLDRHALLIAENLNDAGPIELHLRDLSVEITRRPDESGTREFELVAHVRAELHLQRPTKNGATAAKNTLRVADIEIDLDAHRVRRGSDPGVDLTGREFALLEYLARHPGKVFTRAQLLDQVWGVRYDAYEHTVSSHINRLRAKLEPDPANPRYIETVWGVGYRMADHDPKGAW